MKEKGIFVSPPIVQPLFYACYYISLLYSIELNYPMLWRLGFITKRELPSTWTPRYMDPQAGKPTASCWTGGCRLR